VKRPSRVKSPTRPVVIRRTFEFRAKFRADFGIVRFEIWDSELKAKE